MNIDDILKDSENKFIKNKQYLDSLPAQERKKIEEKKIELSYKVKGLLDKKGVGISDINTSFYKDYKTKDNEVIDVFQTIYTSTHTQRVSTVITDAKTMKILYVRTGITKYIFAKDFFEI